MPDPSDFWIFPLDGAYAVRSAYGIELEGIESFADARAHILDLIAEAQDEAAAQDDFEADRLAEAAAECEAGFAALLAEAA